MAFITHPLVLINPLQHPVNLLLEQRLQLLDHELINWTPLNEISDQTLHSVTLVNNDPLKPKISDIYIDIKFGLPLVLPLHVVLQVRDPLLFFLRQWLWRIFRDIALDRVQRLLGGLSFDRVEIADWLLPLLAARVVRFLSGGDFDLAEAGPELGRLACLAYRGKPLVHSLHNLGPILLLLDNPESIVLRCFEGLILFTTLLRALQILVNAVDLGLRLLPPHTGVLFAKLVDNRLVGALVVRFVVLMFFLVFVML